MAGFIRNLRNPFTGNYIFPVTKTHAVYDKEGRRLDRYLDSLYGSPSSNILINSNFKNPVNQRGVTKNTTGSDTYLYDRWLTGGEINLSGENTNVLSLREDSGISYQYQKIEEGVFSDTDTVTISAKINGKVFCGSCKISTFAINDSPHVAKFDGGWLSVWRGSTTGLQQAGIIFNKVGLYKIEWIKLEIGGIATPYTPRLYAEELQLCQRYFQIHSTNSVSEVDLRPNMRVTPTITEFGSNYSYDAEL